MPRRSYWHYEGFVDIRRLMDRDYNILVPTRGSEVVKDRQLISRVYIKTCPSTKGVNKISIWLSGKVVLGNQLVILVSLENSRDERAECKCSQNSL